MTSCPFVLQVRRREARPCQRLARATRVAMRIIRDAGGVRGLHVALDIFSEEAERRLFQSTDLHFMEADAHVGGNRTGRHHGPLLPDDCYRCCNAVVDSGLFPDLIMPEYCFAISYPGPSAASGGARFAAHFDSRYRWGETVTGITLGQGCIMEWLPDKDEVKLNYQPA